jgi:hypothetical protein
LFFVSLERIRAPRRGGLAWSVRKWSCWLRRNQPPISEQRAPAQERTAFSEFWWRAGD